MTKGASTMKKISAPEDVEPVTVGKTRYEAPHWGKTMGYTQNGGHVSAVDVATGKTLWTVELYHIDYKPNMETDKQDSFLVALDFDSASSRLVAENDRGRRFALDPFSRQVTAL
jgi:outer membrane protein assembly factor BamB